MKKKCLYSIESCPNSRYLSEPLCHFHYNYLLNIINQSSDDYENLNQSGGNLLSAVSKIGQLASKHTGTITNTVSKMDQMISKAEDLTGQASQLSNRVEGITSQISSLTGSFDSQFSQNQLVANTPLGTQGNFQSFGDYVCIRKSFLADLRVLLFELLANRTE